MTQSSPSDAPNVVRVPVPTVKPLLTYIQIAIIVVIFIIQVILLQVVGYEPFTQDGAVIVERVRAGEIYRLFTAMFLHANEAHIFLNALSLFFVGRFVESIFGYRKFAAIYFVGGIIGSIVAYLGGENVVGASGAIFAVIGAQGVFLYLNRHVLRGQAEPLLRQIALNAGLLVLVSVVGRSVPGTIQISLWGHLGGLAGGIALAWYLSPRFTPPKRP